MSIYTLISQGTRCLLFSDRLCWPNSVTSGDDRGASPKDKNNYTAETCIGLARVTKYHHLVYITFIVKLCQLYL